MNSAQLKKMSLFQSVWNGYMERNFVLIQLSGLKAGCDGLVGGEKRDVEEVRGGGGRVRPAAGTDEARLKQPDLAEIRTSLCILWQKCQFSGTDLTLSTFGAFASFSGPFFLRSAKH